MVSPTIFRIPLSRIQGRLDAPANTATQVLRSKTYKNVAFSKVAAINPRNDWLEVTDEMDLSFVPMEAVDEYAGAITSKQTRNAGASKGYTKFQQNDILWAKITPCMQNGKAAIAENLTNGLGFGSTEFHVFRVNPEVANAKYVHTLLRLERLRAEAKKFFSGSAGHQRVDEAFFKKLLIPLPPLNIQEQVAMAITAAYVRKEELEAAATQLLAKVRDVMYRELGLPRIVMGPMPIIERVFLVAGSRLSGNIFDPKTHAPRSVALLESLTHSKFPTAQLREVITHRMAGDWGEDEGFSDGSDEYERRLVIRGTEFDNELNLRIENGREKFRNVKLEKLIRMQVEVGDILIEKSGGSPDQPVGRVAILEDALLDSQSICYSNFVEKIKPDPAKVLPAYLFHYLRFVHAIGVTDLLQSQTNGIRNLMIHRYLGLPVSLPKLAKQAEIVAEINALQSEAIALRAKAKEVLDSAKHDVEKMILGD
jgi:restriction endonuclease S subunit